MTARIGVIIHTSLATRLFNDDDRERLNRLGDVRWTESPDPLTEEEAIQLLKGCSIAVGSWQTPHPSPRVVASCPQLKLWEHVAGTVTRFFGSHLDGSDLMIASCKTANADNVAQMTLAQLITGLRRIDENAVANRSGIAAPPTDSRVMFESTVGIVGASEVGRRVIALLQPLRARILLYDPFVDGDEARALGVEKVDDLTQLCSRCDAVTLHTPNLPATRRLMGKGQFRAMPDDAVFVNTARGACVDEEALIAELEKGRLRAYLDVTDGEPASDESSLRRLANVVLTSHIGGLPTANMGNQAVDDIAAFLRGDRPMAVITEDMLDRIA